MSKRILFPLVISAILLAPSCKDGEATQEKGKSTPPGLSVEANRAENIWVSQTINSTGSLLPAEEVTLRAEQAGRILSIGFKEGADVKQGELLFLIDDREYQAQRDKLKIQLKLAELEHQRNSELIKIEAVSQSELDATENKVLELQSELQLVQAKIDKCRITAPFSGKAGLRYVSPGSFVQLGENLGGLTQVNPLKLEFEVPELFAASIEKGQVIKFRLDETPDTFTAKVYATEQSLNRQSRNLKVRAIVDNPSSRFVPGSFVSLSVAIAEAREAIYVPAESLVPVLDGQQVWLVRGGKLAPQRVNIGRRTSQSVQITDGLQVGDTVLCTGLLQARPGREVSIAKWVKVQ
ncbi:MAG: efflux RND transporter periplasmic adaptor subunit [Bacteroidetes bacterium]|nr:MAG: efflux RND transporter periplasmic adaptor subunit [Bacteroidota bacterium]